MIEAGKSYSLVIKSEFIYNIVIGHIYKINKDVGIAKGKTLFGKYIVKSDDLVPNDKRVVISNIEREGFKLIYISKVVEFIPILFDILGIEDKEMLKFCKDNLKKKHIESVYYYVVAMQESCLQKEFDVTKAKYIIGHYTYKGHHSITEKYNTVVDFGKSPTVLGLYQMLNVFNDDNGGFNSLVSVISNIVDSDAIPQYLKDKLADTFEDFNFIKNMLNISVAMLKTKSREEFAIYLVHNIIKG